MYKTRTVSVYPLETLNIFHFIYTYPVNGFFIKSMVILYFRTILAHRLIALNTINAVPKQMDDSIRHVSNAQMLHIMIYEAKDAGHVMKSNVI